MLFGMNFQAINAGKKDSLGGGYADHFGTGTGRKNNANGNSSGN
jgi:hypothetical protein